MREIIHIQIGNAGNIAGGKFWEVLCTEHGINPSGVYEGSKEYQLEKINVYFNRRKRKKYEFVPRAVLVDLDCDSLKDVYYSKYGEIFRSENFICGFGGTGNNWAKGYFTEGKSLADFVLDSTRTEAERCDCLEGLQVVHSIGGGTGSGLGSLLLGSLCDEYRNRYISTYTIFPSPNIIDDRTQTYNAVLALRFMSHSNMQTFCLDNKALEYVSERSLGVPKASYQDMNYIISTLMSAITTTSRLPCCVSQGLGKSSVNMIPFPKLKYLSTGFAPITRKWSKKAQNISVMQLANELLNPDNIFTYPKIEGVYLSAKYIYRGDMTAAEIKDSAQCVFQKNRKLYLDWIPDNVKSEACPVALGGRERAGAIAGNTTSIRALFQRILDLFDSIHQGRLYTRWFTDEGVEEDELDEARTYTSELIQEYIKCEEATKSDVW